MSTHSHISGVQITLHLVGSGWSRARYWFHTENFSSDTCFMFFKWTCRVQTFVLPCLWAELWQAKESIESKKMGVKYYLKSCSYKNLYEILAPWRCLRSVGGPQKRSIRGKKQWQWQCIGNCNPSKLSDIKNIIITIFLIPNWKLVNKPFSSSLSKSWSWLPTSKK